MTLKKDSQSLLIAAAGILLSIIHIWQFFHSGFVVQCLLRGALYLTLSIMTIFMGKKSIIIECLLFAFIVTWLNDFVNFTGFFVLLLSCKIAPKIEKHLLALYVMNVCIAFMVKGLMISHLVIHLTTCFIFYLVYFIANKKKPLNLTDDETAILEELKAGKHQKEIDLFSKNIITKKLNDAKARNNINTTEELLAVFTRDTIP